MRKSILLWRRLREVIERVGRIWRLIGLLLGRRSGCSLLLIGITISRRWLEEPKISAFVGGHIELESFPENEG